ncbi:hypothetical protein MRB53_033004 [Persea americana]|uniref:Uncharacterized protein n=1 Tax=Persea americana TaxID=3435 RepID=A0ACC2KTB6_PERAE|nr:hypothetical protein MRB53_033004 [Persea americana]
MVRNLTLAVLRNDSPSLSFLFFSLVLFSSSLARLSLLGLCNLLSAHGFYKHLREQMQKTCPTWLPMKRGGDYDVEVKGVKISPDPVVRGKPATFSISASTVKQWRTRHLGRPMQKLPKTRMYFGPYPTCIKTSAPPLKVTLSLLPKRNPEENVGPFFPHPLQDCKKCSWDADLSTLKSFSLSVRFNRLLVI